MAEHLTDRDTAKTSAAGFVFFRAVTGEPVSKEELADAVETLTRLTTHARHLQQGAELVVTAAPYESLIVVLNILKLWQRAHLALDELTNSKPLNPDFSPGLLVCELATEYAQQQLESSGAAYSRTV
jgi:hypothetical protein